MNFNYGSWIKFILHCSFCIYVIEENIWYRNNNDEKIIEDISSRFILHEDFVLFFLIIMTNLFTIIKLRELNREVNQNPIKGFNIYKNILYILYTVLHSDILNQSINIDLKIRKESRIKLDILFQKRSNPSCVQCYNYCKPQRVIF